MEYFIVFGKVVLSGTTFINQIVATCSIKEHDHKKTIDFHKYKPVPNGDNIWMMESEIITKEYPLDSTHTAILDDMINTIYSPDPDFNKSDYSYNKIFVESLAAIDKSQPA